MPHALDEPISIHLPLLMATAHNGQIVKLTPLEVEKSNNAKGISAGQAALAARSFSQTANVDDGKKPLFDIEIFDNL